MTTATTDLGRPDVHLHIGTERLAEGSAGTFEHVNPATGQVDKIIPLAGPAEVDRAVSVAAAAFATWKRTVPAERARLLNRLADLIDARTEDFARLGAMDNGTPMSGGAGGVGLSTSWIRYYAGWADKVTSEVTSTLTAGGDLGYTLRQPYGVIGIIITWNGPLISLAMKIPAAVAAGNTVVVKPSELTPFSGELFAELVAEAGFPPGVINILPGDAASGAALVEHPQVKKISFTGGPATASKILAACAPTMKPAVLELGGKSANIIFEDADLDAACGFGTIMSVGLLAGQGCAFPTRMLVQQSIYEEVVARVKAIAETIVVGDPFAPDTFTGPVVNQAAFERIQGAIAKAAQDGARLVTGGAPVQLDGDLAGGYYLQPTVFADVDPDSDLAQEEVFGPVLAIIPFRDEAHAIEIANNTRYGLSGYVNTKDIGRALRVAEELVTGEVKINGAASLVATRPFGGLGLSGLGKEGGRAGIEEYLFTKGVGIA
ncbi:aldehyde dehydrogenase family protein [Nocardia harenae]|uniref:aldehyde dehydrogenase family protein n=1 Tax=Nocardia harenae TaxID=358707 RepID=UPI0008297604|nr:aldehyde dehydrogenase family protein [Nocardia harenae]